MGGSASLLQVPHEVLTGAEAAKLFESNKNNLEQSQLSSQALANVRRVSFSDSGRLTISKKREVKRAPHEVPTHVKDLLTKIGIRSIPSKTKGYAGNTKLLVAHIFDCLDGLQHMVKADQDMFPINEGEDMLNETHSVMETNRECVGQLLHEMIALYSVCGDTVKVLLQSSPEAAHVEDAFGRLPLHVAVDRDMPWMDAVSRLIDAYPDALNRRDGGGRLPLHIAVDRQEPNIDVVELLLEHNPQAAMGRRGVGRLPLHYAVFTEKPRLQVIEALLAAGPESAETADVYGRLPLHYAVDKAAPDIEVVRCLLRAFPRGASVRDAHLKLPLTVALERDPVDLRVVQQLLEAYPQALTERGGAGNRLPLQSLIESQPRNIAAIEFVARRCCEAITSTSDPLKRDSPVLVALDRGLHQISRILLRLRPDADPLRLRELNWRARKIAFLLAKKQIFRPSVLRRLASLVSGLSAKSTDNGPGSAGSPITASTKRRFSGNGAASRVALMEQCGSLAALQELGARSQAQTQARGRAHSVASAGGHPPFPSLFGPTRHTPPPGALTIDTRASPTFDSIVPSCGSGDCHDVYCPLDSPSPRRSGCGPSGSPRSSGGTMVSSGGNMNFYLRLYKTNSDAFRLAVTFL